MTSFDSLINLLSSELQSYIDNNQPISNGKFKQEDIDKWRIWHPCPIQPEYWHDYMLNYISFDVTFADSNPIITMHFTIDDLVATCTGSKPVIIKHKTDTPEDTTVIPSETARKLRSYLRLYLKILEHLFDNCSLSSDKPVCHAL